MIQTMKYAPHKFAKLVPEPSASEQEELTNDIKENGLLEPIILFEGQILDGRSRQKACQKAGIELRSEDFIEFDPKAMGDPLAFVVSKNFKRRQLQMTPSQKAAYVAEHILPLFEARAEPESPPTGGNGKGIENERVKTKTKRAVGAAAAKSGVSPRSLERAKRVKEKDPEKLKEVAAGKKTLRKAERELGAKAKQENDRTEAFERIEKTLGKDHGFFKGTKGKGPQRLQRTRDIVEFSKLGKDEMEKVAYLMLTTPTWSFKKCVQFESRHKISERSTVRDLTFIAASQGFELKHEFNGWTVELYRSKK
jgi:ParB-like chromosome segregation protein Spo0J